MTPAEQWGYFLTGLALGAGMGIFFGFLQPLQKKRPLLTDLFFGAVAVWVYLFYGFGVCGGDLRLAYLAACLLGFLAWNSLPGRWLQPVFDGFWRCIGRFLRPLGKFFAFSRQFPKKILATAKKWVTIKWRKHLHKTPPNQRSAR